VTADQKRHETAVLGLHDIRGQNGQRRHGTNLSIFCLSRIEQNRIRPLFNATTDVIGYFTLMASALPFWAMRFVAREKEGAIKIDIPWKKRARFIQLVHDENITIKSRILSLQKHWDKAANNALVAKAIQVCASKGVKWMMYGRMGNHPALDNFKQNNGCVKFELTRYYVLLTRKGKIATRLGVHREMKDALPQSIKYRLIPVYNWISRTRVRTKLRSKQKL